LLAKDRIVIFMKRRIITSVTWMILVTAGCSAQTSQNSVTSTPVLPNETSSTITQTSTNENAKIMSFRADVWADNWFSLYINGELVGQDSVSITTERSFNSEQISFTATYPLTIAMVTKDFKQNDSGLEYIRTNRQQMGDGGFIAQFTDTSTGKVVAYTNTSWRGLVVHQAPMDVSCEKSQSPDTDCTSRIVTEPADWTQPAFNDSSWPTANQYSAEQVGVKDGYNDITWSTQAELIWTSDLKIDNTVLWRYTVAV